MMLLGQRTGIADRALQFAILTGVRSGEALGAIWDEFDLEAKLWTIPAERMKAKRDHIVPLSDAVLAVKARELAPESVGILSICGTTV
jgi:integrase